MWRGASGRRRRGGAGDRAQRLVRSLWRSRGGRGGKNGAVRRLVRSPRLEGEEAGTGAGWSLLSRGGRAESGRDMERRAGGGEGEEEGTGPASASVAVARQGRSRRKTSMGGVASGSVAACMRGGGRDGVRFGRWCAVAYASGRRRGKGEGTGPSVCVGRCGEAGAGRGRKQGGRSVWFGRCV